MLRNRIIPVLLLQDGGFVKTKQFKYYKYLGDPINIIKIFNEKKVDEVVIYDIDKSNTLEHPDFELLERISRQCKVPLCYGGGIKNVEQAIKLLALGYEKISISSLFFQNPREALRIRERIGSQSLIITLDFKKNLFGSFDYYLQNGQKKSGIKSQKIIELINEIQPGEIVLSSINNDGMRTNYDLKIIDQFRDLNIPLTICGGANGIESFEEAKSIHDSIGLGASSIFVFKKPLDAVLIQYLETELKEKFKIRI